MSNWKLDNNKSVIETALANGLSVVILTMNVFEKYHVLNMLKDRLKLYPDAKIIFNESHRIIVENNITNQLEKTRSIIYVLPVTTHTPMALRGLSLNLVLFTTGVNDVIKEDIIKQIYPQMIANGAIIEKLYIE